MGLSRFLSGVLVVTSLTGCGGAATLQVANKAPLLDQSVPTPAKLAYTIVMVLPPKGSERGQVSELAHLEKALLKQGVRVISSGVTGRVVNTVDQAEGQANAGATQLTDLERALVLARKSGAEALLQVANMEWTKDPANFRYYLLQPDGATFAEVSKADFEAAPVGKQWAVTGPSLHFEAKLIDAESDEIVTAVDLSQSTVHEITAKTLAMTTKGGAVVVNNLGPHATEIDTEDLRVEATVEMMGKLASLIAEGKPHEARASAKEVASDAARKKCEDDLVKSEAERQRLAAAEAKRIEDDKKRAADDAAKMAADADAAKKGPKKK